MKPEKNETIVQFINRFCSDKENIKKFESVNERNLEAMRIFKMNSEIAKKNEQIINGNIIQK